MASGLRTGGVDDMPVVEAMLAGRHSRGDLEYLLGAPDLQRRLDRVPLRAQVESHIPAIRITQINSSISRAII